jgi:hypothetical protein
MDIQYRLIPANTAFGKNKIGKIEPWSTRREDSSKDEWPRKSTKIAKENKTIDITSCLCVLCTAIRQNHAWSRGFFLAQRAPRAQRNNRKKERYVQSLFHLCDLSASARNSFLPGGFWARLAALCSLVFFAFSCGKSLVAQTSRPNSRKSLISMIIPDNSGFFRTRGRRKRLPPQGLENRLSARRPVWHLE